MQQRYVKLATANPAHWLSDSPAGLSVNVATNFKPCAAEPCRVQVLAGFANAVVLVFVALNICLEAGVHLMEGGHDVTTHRLLPVSVAGLAVNLFGLTFAHEAHHHAPGKSSRGQSRVESQQ